MVRKQAVCETTSRRKGCPVPPASDRGEATPSDGHAAHITAVRDIAGRGRDAGGRRQGAQSLRALLDHVPDIIARYDRHLRFVYVNQAVEKLTGTPPEMLVGKTNAVMGVTEAERGVLDEALRQVFAVGQETSVEFQFTTPLGLCHLLSRLVPEFAPGGGVGHVLVISRDATDLKSVEENSRAGERRYRRLVDDGKGLICEHDLGGALLSVNAAAAHALGYEAAEMVGKSLADFVPQVRRPEVGEYLERVRREAGAGGLMRVLKKCGCERVWAYQNVLCEEGGGATFVIGHAHDVTDLKRTEAALRELIVTDELTGLYNRRGFFKVAGQWLKAARRAGRGCALVYADMDGLKQINDAHGHAEGSRAIARVAGVIKDTFRSTDITARIGGDEFTVLVTDAVSQMTVETTVARLQENLHRHDARGEYPYSLTLSVGVLSVGSDVELSIEELLARADERMYEHKREKRARRN